MASEHLGDYPCAVPLRAVRRWVVYAISTGALWALVNLLIFHRSGSQTFISAVIFGALFATLGIWRETRPLRRRRR
jgi:DMSO/TMAO reductase YedYZ heme-binding membrane subunit